MDEEKPSETQAAEETLVVEESSAGNEDAANGNSLDFTGDNTAANQVPTPQVGDKYDPRPQEDSARRTIAYLLIGLLWLIVSGILILLGFKSISVDNIKDFGVVLSPIIALVSAATGFYYGTKSNSTSGK
jgi:hypothetical protein